MYLTSSAFDGTFMSTLISSQALFQTHFTAYIPCYPSRMKHIQVNVFGYCQVEVHCFQKNEADPSEILYMCPHPQAALPMPTEKLGSPASLYLYLKPMNSINTLPTDMNKLVSTTFSIFYQHYNTQLVDLLCQFLS